eukprot:g18468.t1
MPPLPFRKFIRGGETAVQTTEKYGKYSFEAENLDRVVALALRKVRDTGLRRFPSLCVRGPAGRVRGFGRKLRRVPAAIRNRAVQFVQRGNVSAKPLTLWGAKFFMGVPPGGFLFSR